MAINYLDSPVFKSVKANGSPNSLGTVGVYEAGTSFGTLITIYDTQTKDNALTNPVTLDSAGEKEIWFDDVVDIQIKDSDGNVLDQVLNVSSSDSATVTGNYNILKNGSFEVDTDGDGTPDNWTLALDTGGTIAVDATSGGQLHGDNGLKFTGTGSGAGTATSDKFSVQTSAAVKVIFAYKSTVSTVTNTLAINWYQYDDSASGVTATDTVYTATSGHPSSFTTYVRAVAVPSDAVKGELVITGVGSSGTTKVGPTWFDNIQITELLDLEGIIYDSHGNEQVEFGATASAVNNLKITPKA